MIRILAQTFLLVGLLPASLLGQRSACTPALPHAWHDVVATVSAPSLRDSIDLVPDAELSALAIEIVRATNVGAAVRCAVEQFTLLGGLRRYELERSLPTCRLMPASRPCPATPARRPRGGDDIGLARVVFVRDVSSARIEWAELWIIAAGGPVDAAGEKLMQQYDMRLTWRKKTGRWEVRNYHVGIPE